MLLLRAILLVLVPVSSACTGSHDTPQVETHTTQRGGDPRKLEYSVTGVTEGRCKAMFQSHGGSKAGGAPAQSCSEYKFAPSEGVETGACTFYCEQAP